MALALIIVVIILHQIGGGGWVVGSITSSEPSPELLTLGPLAPAKAEVPSPDIIRGITNAVEAREASLRQADMYLVLTERASPLFWEFLTETSSHPGTTTDLPSRDEILGPTTKRVRLAFNGEKMRTEVLVETKDKEPKDTRHPYRRETAYDGTCSYIYYPDMRRGYVDLGRDYVEDEFARLVMMQYGDQPISALLQMEGMKYEGRQTVGGTECVKLAVTKKTQANAKIDAVKKTEIWLAPEFGYAPKRIARSFVPKAGSGACGNCTISEIEEFIVSDNVWIPSKGKNVSYRVREDGQLDWYKTTEWKLVNYSPEAPDWLFKINFPIGTQVFDNAHGGRGYVVGMLEDVDKNTLAGTPKPSY